jgi:hypothetical protein
MSYSKDILLSEALSVSKLLSDQNKKSWYSTILSLLKYLKLYLRFVMNSKNKGYLPSSPITARLELLFPTPSENLPNFI